ncbi:MAG: DNA cytosine methyltransferase [Kurthia sp.]|nr:DNA cytosine methyltransferase [Candidatus Kurthia equi]
MASEAESDKDFFSKNQQFFCDIPIALKAASFFSGAGLMDFGMLAGMNEGTSAGEEQLEVVYAVEKNEYAAKTYRHNIGDHIQCDDIRNIDESLPYQLGATIHFSGTPCQGFSNVNRRSDKKVSYLENPNNLLVRQYIAKIKANPNCAVFVWENVPQLLTKGSAFFLQEIKDELVDFEITTGVLNAKDFGDAQDRERAFLIGSKIGRIELPKREKRPVKTVSEAFYGLNDSIPNQLDYTKSRNDTIERMKAIPPGSNWESLPLHLRNKGMKKGVTQSNIYKRLDPDKPACTIVNPRKCLLMPPHANRILTVRECARLFSLPDTFKFKGPLDAMQQQVANGTCVNVIKAIAKQVKNKICSYNALLKRSLLALV